MQTDFSLAWLLLVFTHCTYYLPVSEISACFCISSEGTSIVLRQSMGLGLS